MKNVDILSFHPGRQHNIEQASQICRYFRNFRHVTSFYFDAGTVRRTRTVLPKIADHLKKRSGEISRSDVDLNPLPEIELLLKRKLGCQLNNRDFLRRNKKFQNWIISRYNPPAICIGFDTSSWLVFEKWKKQSFLILDLSLAAPHYKLKLAELHNLEASVLQKQIQDDDSLYAIYEKELHLADLVLCGSSFVKSSCLSLGIPEAKLHVIPYGVDLSRFKKTASDRKSSEVIKVVFIGSVIYRKGVDILLSAWEQISKRFSNVELHFYGNVQIAISQALKNVFFHGFVDQNRLISELRNADISVLPTYFEGSSLAIYQSMAMELAVITTPNAGSVVEDKRNGLLIEYGNCEQLYEALALLITDSGLRQTLAAAAVADIQRYTWEEYGKKISCLLNDRLSVRNPGGLEARFSSSFG